jgi:hypothetical protein
MRHCTTRSCEENWTCHKKKVLLKYAHVFRDEETNEFKAIWPIRRPPYRTPYALIRSNFRYRKCLTGILLDSKSPWSALAILVPRKFPDGKPKFRFCVDFRALNALTKFDFYPLPRFDKIASTPFGSKYFTVLDCYSGFWQISVK